MPRVQRPSDTSTPDRYQFRRSTRLRKDDPLSAPAQLQQQQQQQLKNVAIMFKQFEAILPALRGRGTPPTKTVLRGSSGSVSSRTTSASDSFHGRICTGLSYSNIPSSTGSCCLNIMVIISSIDY